MREESGPTRHQTMIQRLEIGYSEERLLVNEQ